MKGEGNYHDFFSSLSLEAEQANSLLHLGHNKIINYLIKDQKIPREEIYRKFCDFFNLSYFSPLPDIPIDFAINEIEGFLSKGYIEKQDIIIGYRIFDKEFLNLLLNASEDRKIIICTKVNFYCFINNLKQKEITHESINHLSNYFPNFSAKHVNFKILGNGLIFLILSSALVSIVTGFLVHYIIITNLLYIVSLALKIKCFSNGRKFLKNSNQAINNSSFSRNSRYNIIVPLYNEEKEVTCQNITSLTSLNFDSDNLNIIYALEEEDKQSLLHFQGLCDIIPEQMIYITIPKTLPKTKPKASNYALSFCFGEFVVIYDAEDIPDPDQLIKSVKQFKQESENTACLQAKLNYYNHSENLLTKLFSIEYGLWFNYLVCGLATKNSFIPLGGTSNHFKLEILKKIGKWDAFNVTEDADIGARLSFLGYRVGWLDSLTLEESPIGISNWLKQRARWIKGYLQTLFVHSLNHSTIFSKSNTWKLIELHFYVGFSALTFLMLPINFLLIAFSSFLSNASSISFIAYFISYGSLALTTISFFIGQVIYFQSQNKKITICDIIISFIFPIYFILHSIAAYLALYQLITKPIAWNRTKHGFNLYKQI